MLRQGTKSECLGAGVRWNSQDFWTHSNSSDLMPVLNYVFLWLCVIDYFFLELPYFLAAPHLTVWQWYLGRVEVCQLTKLFFFFIPRSNNKFLLMSKFDNLQVIKIPFQILRVVPRNKIFLKNGWHQCRCIDLSGFSTNS